MKKLLVPILCSIFLGFLMGYYIFHEYDDSLKVKAVFNDTKEQVYFLQLGVYSDLEGAKKSAQDFTNYLYMYEDGKYHVYIGITKNSKNAEKIKGFYEEKGYIIYVKEMIISNDLFIEKLKQYDEILKGTTEGEAMVKVLEKILITYKEVVIDGNNDQGITQK